MLHLVTSDRTYSPETVALMTAAFERVCETAPMMIGNDHAKQTLALTILRYVDQGERDPARLFNIALRELANADHAKAG